MFEDKDAHISVFDHGLLYGDGVFEGIRVYNGNIFKLREHIKRLYQSAKSIYLDVPVSADDLQQTVQDTVQINGKEDAYVRVLVTRGEGGLGLDPGKCAKASVIIIVSDIALYPHEYYQKGISIVTSSTRRIPVDVIDPRVKSLNYLSNILAKIEAQHAGCLEAVMLSKEGFVTECTADNIFIVKDGSIFAPDPTIGALDGITKKTVFDLADKLGISASSALLTRYDLYNADECFLTGTGAEIMPVTAIDGRIIGTGQPGTVTYNLLNGFRKMVNNRELTYI